VGYNIHQDVEKVTYLAHALNAFISNLMLSITQPL